MEKLPFAPTGFTNRVTNKVKVLYFCNEKFKAHCDFRFGGEKRLCDWQDSCNQKQMKFESGGRS